MEPYIYLLVVILSSFYTCTEGDATVARVIGGPSPHIGRVEVYYADQWGGVCGTDNWDIDNAVVACRMIGYSSGRPIYRTTRYGRVTEPVWMAGVDCTGTENNIEDCSFDGWGQSGSCGTYTFPATVFCYNATGSIFDIRLTGGPGPHLGRVEVYYSGYWGTVCGAYDWDYSDASVTCKMLGYSYGQQLYPTNRYGRLFEPIWMGGVHCDGTEDSLSDCSFDGWGQVAHCSTKPACVFCYDPTAGQDIQVRLSGGLGPHMGRVDVYYNGYWGTICDYQDWDVADANVTCRMMGYNIGRRIFQTHDYGDLTEPVWMANVECDGAEDSLADCPFDGWGRFSRCGGFPASVFCYNVTYESEFNFRLSGGPGPYAGRVEVFYSGYWGSVCGLSDWDYRDAIVTCRMLGYSASHHPYITTRYGRITEPIWMAGVQCTGKEDSLADCAFDGWGQADQCGPIAASVFCYNVTEDSAIDIRLVDGSNSSTGYVELYYSGHWGGVCSKDINDHIFEDEGNGTFGDEDAAVACRMLNYREGYALPKLYAHPSKVLWMDNVRCNGTESSLADCPFDGWGNVEYCFSQAYITCYNIVSGQPVTNISIITNSTREGRENSTVDLTCHVSGGVPIPSLKWTCPPSVSASTPYTSRHGDSHTSAITVTLTRQANGQRCNCTGSQTNSSWTGSDQTHVFGVQFGPDKISLTRNKVVVKDGTSTLTLTCTTEEYNKHVHITWYNGTIHVPNTAGVTNISGTYGGFISTQILQLTPDRYQDGNVIKCLVQNEDVSIQEISTSVLLDIRGQPVTNISIITNSTREGRENSTVDLTCHVSGGVPIPSLKWTCPPSVSASTPYTSRHGDSHTSAITVTLTRQANGQRCNCTGSQTNSSWTGSDQTHVFGVQFGPDKISLTRNKVVVKDGTSTLTLTCTTEEYNKHVHITWYNGTIHVPNTAGVTNISGTYGGFISTQILQLTPDRYQDGNVIKCLVQNEDVSIQEISTSVLLDIRDVTTDNGPSIGVIAGGVIGSCLALTAIVAVAAFLICRRRHFRKGTHDSTTNDDNSQSTNHKLELTNISPPSVYSGLKGQEGLQIFTSGRSDYQNVENSGSSPQYVNAHIAENTVTGSQSLPSESTYEALGERPEASVYASLSRSSRCTDHQYVNTSTQ